jgi:hypothetical protein
MQLPRARIKIANRSSPPIIVTIGRRISIGNSTGSIGKNQLLIADPRLPESLATIHYRFGRYCFESPISEVMTLGKKYEIRGISITLLPIAFWQRLATFIIAIIITGSFLQLRDHQQKTLPTKQPLMATYPSTANLYQTNQLLTELIELDQAVVDNHRANELHQKIAAKVAQLKFQLTLHARLEQPELFELKNQELIALSEQIRKIRNVELQQKLMLLLTENPHD